MKHLYCSFKHLTIFAGFERAYDVPGKMVLFSWYFLAPTYSLLNSALGSSYLKLGGCHLLFTSLTLSNSGTLFLSIELLIALYLGE